MRYIKLYEDFKEKNNNVEGTLITQDDVINCIKSGGIIYASIIQNFADNDPDKPLRPVSIDEDGLVTVEFEGKDYEVKLKNIEKIEY
jgi:hypothetical protein